jgi:GTP-binding protein HflX
LEEIDVHGLPVVTALNKIDTLADPQIVYELLDDFERAVAISALTGQGVPTLLKVLEDRLRERLSPISVTLPYAEGRLITWNCGENRPPGFSSRNQRAYPLTND